METVTLPAAFPAAYRRVYLGKFEGVSNGGALKEALIAASKTPADSDERRRVDFAFVDARLVLSRQQLLTAVMQAIVAADRLSQRDEAPVGMKTPSIHSEILWTLNPNNNIADALRQFGVSASTETLILVRVDALPPAGPDPAALAQHMDALVDGTLVAGIDTPTMASLALSPDSRRWKDVGKTYKLQDTSAFQQHDTQAVEALVCSTVATKYVGT
ncbi:hypothetical protein MCAP1_000295 [Malassezia caprae]|uniref:EKC/KEOPS complex subunit CGI121 n=1 Tax=Malassezia caprae TaxID=1381934 RepID=A0AAF0IV22_9BASI|nr:hypothetical protein MCAP1_000295 [Malassezia caprae]